MCSGSPLVWLCRHVSYCVCVVLFRATGWFFHQIWSAWTEFFRCSCNHPWLTLNPSSACHSSICLVFCSFFFTTQLCLFSYIEICLYISLCDKLNRSLSCHYSLTQRLGNQDFLVCVWVLFVKPAFSYLEKLTKTKEQRGQIHSPSSLAF